MGQTLPYSPSRPLALPLLLFTNCLVALLTTIIFLIMLILYIDLGVGVGIWGLSCRRSTRGCVLRHLHNSTLRGATTRVDTIRCAGRATNRCF